MDVIDFKHATFYALHKNQWGMVTIVRKTGEVVGFEIVK